MPPPVALHPRKSDKPVKSAGQGRAAGPGRAARPPRAGTSRRPGGQLAKLGGLGRLRKPRRLPNPRFTGLGAGLFAASTMLCVAFLDRLLLDSAPLVYGALFLPVSAVTALWVRTADLVTAPISVPIAFAVGSFPIAGGSGGFGGHTMALVTTLAVHAGWLYGGTLVAGLIASVRKVRQMGRRQRARDAAALRAGSKVRPARTTPPNGATAYRAVRRG
ncbi:DUF6542 domain-containing protein [Streptomyces sp. NBC_00872]|uniref:DUF6542 domain-containing protein n=1 Tax=Streptomyces sp. NBC_00872 TaxID=2903686 RepID=UPI0038704E76|nr:hypothetical protein OG214_14055 [Streptomyces sp. NBC_00872]